MYYISKEMGKRIEILRVFLMILVVFIHSDTDNITNIIIELPKWFVIIKMLLSKIVARIAVPLFFLISAIFIFSKTNKYSYKDNLKKKFRSLIIPYIFWNLLWIIIFALGQKISFTSSFFSNSDRIIANFDLQQWLYSFGIIQYNASTSPFLYPFWFIRDLIILNLIYPLIKFIYDKVPLIAIIIIFFMYMVGAKIGVLSSESLLFFLLGYIIVKEKITFEKVDNISYLILIPSYLILVFATMISNINVIILKLSVLVGIFLAIRLSGELLKNKKSLRIILKISPYTFFIYATHEWTLSFMRKICLRIIGINIKSLIFVYFGLTVIIVSIAIMGGKLLSKIIPRFYNFIVGSR